MKAVNLFKLCISRFHTWMIGLKSNIQVGTGTIIFYKSRVFSLKKSGKIEIGNNCLIGRDKKGYQAGMPFYTTIFCDVDNSRVEIGNNCRINGAYVHAQSQIIIGDNCVVATGVNIIDSNGHELRSTNRTVGRDTPRPIIIGNNVWIGLNAIILKGTEIGDNSVVAAGTVVKGYYPANSIIHPAAIDSEQLIFDKNN